MELLLSKNHELCTILIALRLYQGILENSPNDEVKKEVETIGLSSVEVKQLYEDLKSSGSINTERQLVTTLKALNDLKKIDFVFELSREQLKVEYGVLRNSEISVLSEKLSQIYSTCTITPTKIPFSIPAADMSNLDNLNEKKLLKLVLQRELTI